VFLVHHDEAQLPQGGEHRGTGSHHEGSIAAADAPPLLLPLSRREAAVEQGHPLPEASAKTGDGLGRQRDFRYKDEGLPALGQHAFRRPHVHFRFAAARHPLKQHRPGAGIFGQPSFDDGQCPLLLRGKGRPRPVGPAGAARPRPFTARLQPIVTAGGRLLDDEAPLKEGRQRPGGRARFLQQQAALPPAPAGRVPLQYC